MTTAPEEVAESRPRLKRRPSMSKRVALALMLMLSCFIIAAGQTPVAPPCTSKPLVQPPDIRPTGNRLSSALVIRMKTWYWLVQDATAGTPVPVAGTSPSATAPPICSYPVTQKDKDGNPVVVQTNAQVFSTQLRTYGYPKDPAKWNDPAYLSKDENINWAIPGPTFHLMPGQALDLTMYNALDPAGARNHRCDNLGQAPQNYDAYPNCFHGDNVTNMHFHGLRVSPAAPQDNVFLDLFPADPKVPATCAKTGNVGNGCYQARLDPIQDIQPIGTHWYHPHKHGGTALQVMNGLAGAFLIEGYFDKDLDASVAKQTKTPTPPEQKVLVVQQLRSTVNFLNKQPGGNGGQFWVDGQRQPTIRMKPGEIQRWRFIGATQQLGAFQALQFDGTQMRSRQISQDGVPFDPANYNKQPLNLVKSDSILDLSLLRADNNPVFERLPATATAAQIESNAVYVLAPGSRVDLLVVAPTTKGIYDLKYIRVANLSPIPTSKLDAQQAATPDVNTLLRVEVTDQKDGGAICKDVNTCLQGVTLPPLPNFLRDIDPEPKKKDTVAFIMNPNAPATVNDAGAKVFINNRLYNPGFIDHRVSLRNPEQWQITNSSTIPHPFHIHVNPFQLTQVMNKTLPKPWVWFDVFAIPIQKASTGLGSITIRQRFIGFTGKFVLHCHILGHEDRGMMQNVLAVP